MIAMKIVKRKRGNNAYFYLKSAFRKNGKVVTKERYLGKEIPKNIEQLKKEFVKEEKAELLEKLERIKKNFQKQWSAMPKTAKEKELQEIAIAFTYNTNAIEGSKITLPDTRQILQDHLAPNKLLYQIKETESHAKVFLELIGKKAKIRGESMLQWHNQLFVQTKPDIAGKYREYLVRVGSYNAPDWQDVEKLMDELAKFCNSAKMNAVELAARAHYRFEKIHPFGDGNGRIGRLLMNHILWHSGYPMLIMESKTRRSYYRALERDEEKFVSYLFRMYLKVHGKRM